MMMLLCTVFMRESINIEITEALGGRREKMCLTVSSDRKEIFSPKV